MASRPRSKGCDRFSADGWPTAHPFLVGMGSVLDLSGGSTRYRQNRPTTARSFQRDAEAVNRDLWAAWGGTIASYGPPKRGDCR